MSISACSRARTCARSRGRHARRRTPATCRPVPGGRRLGTRYESVPRSPVVNKARFTAPAAISATGVLRRPRTNVPPNCRCQHAHVHAADAKVVEAEQARLRHDVRVPAAGCRVRSAIAGGVRHRHGFWPAGGAGGLGDARRTGRGQAPGSSRRSNAVSGCGDTATGGHPAGWRASSAGCTGAAPRPRGSGRIAPPTSSTTASSSAVSEWSHADHLARQQQQQMQVAPRRFDPDQHAGGHAAPPCVARSRASSVGHAPVADVVAVLDHRGRARRVARRARRCTAPWKPGRDGASWVLSRP